MRLPRTQQQANRHSFAPQNPWPWTCWLYDGWTLLIFAFLCFPLRFYFISSDVFERGKRVILAATRWKWLTKRKLQSAKPLSTPFWWFLVFTSDDDKWGWSFPNSMRTRVRSCLLKIEGEKLLCFFGERGEWVVVVVVGLWLVFWWKKKLFLSCLDPPAHWAFYYPISSAFSFSTWLSCFRSWDRLGMPMSYLGRH